MPIKLPKNYKDKSTPELQSLKIEMEQKLATIDYQVGKCSLVKPMPATGYGSMDWLIDANLSRKRYVCDIARIELVLQERKIPGDHPAAPLTEAFIKVARRRLDKVAFDSIMEEAREET